MMPLEKQVCSLELAKELKRLGVRQESAFYWYGITNDDGINWQVKLDEWVLTGPQRASEFERYSAFTVAELGVAFPNVGCLVYTCNLTAVVGEQEWRAIYADEHHAGGLMVRHEEMALTEADARAKMLCYLLENKIITVDEVNKRLREGV